jgi:hypothetical protein
MEELLFKVLERKVVSKDDITSIEAVYVMTEFNDYFNKDISIFEIIECVTLEEIYDLYK